MAAAAVASSSKLNPSVTNPVHMFSSRLSSPKHPPPSRSPQPSTSSASPLPDPANNPNPPPKTFKRLRSSLEQSIRSARGRGKPPPTITTTTDDAFATVTTVRPGPEPSEEDKDKDRSNSNTNMLRRLETKVNFRRTSSRKDIPHQSHSHDPSSPPSSPPPDGQEQREQRERKDSRFRQAGFSSFLTPSLRQASMSSPAIHLSSQPFPSPRSESAFPASSSSHSAALVSPTRPRHTKGSQSLGGDVISGPSPLTPKRASSSRSGVDVSPTPQGRLRKSRPSPLLPSSPSSPDLLPSSSPPTSPTRSRSRSTLHPPETPTSPRRRPSSPSPLTPRSPSRSRVLSPTAASSQRGLTSASTSHLPSTSSASASASSSAAQARRGSVDSQARRGSIDSQARRSSDSQRPHSRSPSASRANSPSAPLRPRALSPSSRVVTPTYNYNQRHLNASSTSLASVATLNNNPSSVANPNSNSNSNSNSGGGTGGGNPEHREAIRQAASMLCKEMLKTPALVQAVGVREAEEIEVRMRALTRLERVWGKSGTNSTVNSGGIGNGNAKSAGEGGGNLGGGTAAGEERERRLFAEALRDGYVLCQLMNKLRPGSIPRIDSREDGKVRTSNVTRFLAACANHGIGLTESESADGEMLFQRDDLIEGTSEALARVARCVVGVVRWAEGGGVGVGVGSTAGGRSKVIRGGGGGGDALRGGGLGAGGGAGKSPYGPGSVRGGSTSTPNLSVGQNINSNHHHHSNSQNTNHAHGHGHGPTTPRKRWTPPSPALPTVRSHTPSDASSDGEGAANARTGTTITASNTRTTPANTRSGTGNTTNRTATPNISLDEDVFYDDGRDTPTLGIGLAIGGGGEMEVDDVPPMMMVPPPRSPLRSRRPSDRDRESLSSSVGADGGAERQSMASSAGQTETTDTTTYSSLLDVGGGGGRVGGQYRYGRERDSGNGNRYGTIRTMTTEATSFVPSEWPSLSRTEGSMLADDLQLGRKNSTSNSISTSNPSPIASLQIPSIPVPTSRRERRPSEGAVVDLSRVAEEAEDFAAARRDARREKLARVNTTTTATTTTTTASAKAEVLERERIERINLGKGKWPDDFLDALLPKNANVNANGNTNPNTTRPIPIKYPPSTSDRSESRLGGSSSPSPHSHSMTPSPGSPRKFAVVGFNGSGSPGSGPVGLGLGVGVGGVGSNESVDSLPQLVARRPTTHKSRHSVDVPPAGLLPRERDMSPDSGAQGRGMMRRNSTKTSLGGGVQVQGRNNGVYLPSSRKNGTDEEVEEGAGGNGDGDGEGLIPFPRSVSADQAGGHVAVGASKEASGSGSGDEAAQRRLSEREGRGSTLSSSSKDRDRPPLQPRGRFQSEVDGSSSRRRPRPNSYDEFGAKPMLGGLGINRRSRFESMVNLGAGMGAGGGPGGSGTNSPLGGLSASDLLAPPREGRESRRNSADGGYGLGVGGNGASAVRKTLVVREEGRPPTHFQLGNCIGRGQFGAVYRALNLNTGQMVAVKRIGLDGLKEEEVTTLMREVDLVKSLSHPSIVKYEGMARDENTLSIVLEYAENGSLGQTLKAFGKLNERLVASYVVKILEGLHYLHQSDVVHCDLKAANILTTKNGNVKLSDFGVSLNLRAMEREIKDVAGTPNWMAPEVIELKGASTKSDIWSLACTVIELLTGKPPYGDIANTMTVMFRIVEDEMPPLPEGISEPLSNFLRLCFDKDPELRPSAELLCEHEWLKKHWGAHKDLRPQDSIPFLRRVSADLHKHEGIRHLASLDMSEPAKVEDETPSSPRRLSNGTVPPPTPLPQTIPDSELLSVREHTFVKTTFSKPVICRVCMQNVKKSAVLCSQCSLIAHSKCAANAPPTCDLRSQLLLYAHFAERGSPVDFISASRGPTSVTSDGNGAASSSRASLDVPPHSPPPNSTSSTPIPHPPTAYKVRHPFKRQSRQSLTPEPAPSSAASATVHKNKERERERAGQGHQEHQHHEENIIRRKFSILGRTHTKETKEPPKSISSSSSPHTSSMRSMNTAPESLSSRHAAGVSGGSGMRSATETGTRMSGSRASEADTTTDIPRESRMSIYSGTSVAGANDGDVSVGMAEGMPGGMDPGTRRTKKGKHESRGKEKEGGCIIQ